MLCVNNTGIDAQRMAAKKVKRRQNEIHRINCKKRNEIPLDYVQGKNNKQRNIGFILWCKVIAIGKERKKYSAIDWDVQK